VRLLYFFEVIGFADVFGSFLGVGFEGALRFIGASRSVRLVLKRVVVSRHRSLEA